MPSERVTIYSIPGPNSWENQNIPGGWNYAFKSVEFIAELNPDLEFDVVFGHLDSFGSIPSLPVIPRVHFYIYETQLQNLEVKNKNHQSSQHGSLLNFALGEHKLSTRFYIILDPDCFLLRFHGISLMLNYLEIMDLSLIGVCYPTDIQKLYYWDFPVAYFQCIDSQKVPANRLNFLPDENSYVPDRRQASGFGFKNPKLVQLGHWFNYHSRLPLHRLNRWIRSRNNHFAIFVSNFSKNYPYRNFPLYRDTGWFNRLTLKEDSYEVLPHRVDPIISRGSFRSLNYAGENNLAAYKQMDSGWHAMAHGIYEGRNLGRQNLFYRLLRLLVAPRVKRPDVFPFTSITMEFSYLTKVNSSYDWGKMENAFEYFWQGDPFCIHLGHQGKSDDSQDMARLDYLLTEVNGHLERA